jgi:hypothetical protein
LAFGNSARISPSSNRGRPNTCDSATKVLAYRYVADAPVEGFAEVTFDLNKKRDHAFPCGARLRRQSSKTAAH